ncbi:AAA family ATPase [Pseudoalteromonas sp. APC 3356]|uniref:AAA family ATPase n=1 Tax=Pseudoalteromonas sp. APC 3356 TaxID=3035185 RepID=UPI0025B4207D|nr:AAA family ATPase [Pseudoalteromonas sp. APC 3356]MDN3436369.1 AAA family ATPase [Pseudoalteromonas sp. APC 3356]
MEFVKRLDIKSFGSYSNFVWKDKIKSSKNETEDFKKLNILYGRNYSGKTTLSRIFRSFEIGSLPSKISLPEFKIFTDDGELTQLDVNKGNLEVRVYNKDFISDNLSFLVDDEGHISPIAIIGDDNTKIEQQIADKRAILGSVENKDGLYHEYEIKKQSHAKLNSKIVSLATKLEKSLTDKANKKPNGIKHQTKFAVSTYNINALKADIKTVSGGDYFLSEDNETRLEQLIQDQKKSQLSLSITAPTSLKSLLISVNLLLTRKIKPSRPIQDLLDDHLLQDWVKQGRKHHEAKRETCGFCGNALPIDLWNKLDAHFDLESEKLEDSLRLKVNEVAELFDM